MEHENSENLIPESPSEDLDSSLEDVHVKESVTWLHNQMTVDFTYEEMTKWKKEGSVHEYHHFCNPEVFDEVFKAKNALPKDTTDNKYQNARFKSNPFGKIQNVFFINRASLKMANIDTVTDYMFTKINENINFAEEPGPCYFADVCAGPGGFSEYILWKTKETFKGFGFTLKDSNDFNLQKSVCVSSIALEPFYGVKGDGNVYDPANINDFRKKVLQATDNKGVHFVMSDGGFETGGREDEQETLSNRLYICQCLVALEILRTHGHFVTKVFDVFTCFSVGLIYLMYKCFEKICILKPNTSRPANSERYLICSNLRDSEQFQEIRHYLKSIVNTFWQLDNDKKLDKKYSITEIVPLDTLKRDQDFYSYIFDSNNRIAKRQIVHLKKFLAFFNDSNLEDNRQQQFRKECLKYWKIPDVDKKRYTKRGNFRKDEYVPMYQIHESYPMDFSKLTPDPNQWHYAFLQMRESSSDLGTFFAEEENKVTKLNGKEKRLVNNLKLTRGTVLFGELVKETSEIKDGLNLQQKESLHVIDALTLGPNSLSKLTLEERMSRIEIYCKIVNREGNDSMRVRAKAMRPLPSLVGDYQQLAQIEERIYSFTLPLLGCRDQKQSYDVNSVLLLSPADSLDSVASPHSSKPGVLRRFKVIEPTLNGDNLQKFVEFIKSRTHC